MKGLNSKNQDFAIFNCFCHWGLNFLKPRNPANYVDFEHMFKFIIIKWGVYFCQWHSQRCDHTILGDCIFQSRCQISPFILGSNNVRMMGNCASREIAVNLNETMWIPIFTCEMLCLALAYGATMCYLKRWPPGNGVRHTSTWGGMKTGMMSHLLSSIMEANFTFFVRSTWFPADYFHLKHPHSHIVHVWILLGR